MRAFANSKERDAESSKYEELCVSVKQWSGFTNMDTARLEADIVKVAQEWDVSAEKAE